MPMKNDNWKLPVPVWASFDLNHAKMSEEVADKAHQMGKYLMQKLMTAQSIDPTFIDEIVEKKIAGLYDIYEHYRHCGEIFLTEIELQKMACTFRPTMWQNYS